MSAKDGAAGSAITDTDILNWLEKQLDPGCFYTLSHYEHASQFFGQAPKGWSKETPIGLGEFPEHFGSTLRDAISAAIRAESPNSEASDRTTTTTAQEVKPFPLSRPIQGSLSLR